MRLFLRILVGAIVAVVALAVAVVVSVPVDRWLTRDRLAELTNVELSGPDGPLLAYAAVPEGASSDDPLPAVIMIHEFWGLKPTIVGKAEALAEEGYLVIAPDTFRGRTTSWVPSAIWNVLSTPQTQIDADLDAVYRWLARRDDVDPARIAVMGFCYGGGASLAYSLHNPELAATGVFYGTLITDPLRLEALPGPLLGVFGAEDASIPLREVRAFEQALEEAGVPHEITVYDGVGHAFVQGVEQIRQGGPPGEAWEQLLEFLDQTLRLDVAVGALP